MPLPPIVHKNVKLLMGGMALGRKVLETGESFQLKEEQNSYIAHFGVKKCKIDAQNEKGIHVLRSQNMNSFFV